MRVLLVTDDRVGPAMAGSALRAWELARALSAAGHTVHLAAAEGSTAPFDAGEPVHERAPWRWAQAVVAPPWSLPPRAFVGSHRLVVDGVTPLLAELAAMPATPEVVRRRRTASARLPLVRRRADAVLVAGPAQAAWWRLRLRPGVPLLEVPFGIPESPPLPDVDPIPGVPRAWSVVLWWGGTWPWLDLDTLLAARARLGRAPVAVAVPTAARPGGRAALSPTELAERAARHGLVAPQVVSLGRWSAYADRHRVLNRAAVLAVLHHPGEEAELSFRTRALDGMWAGRPLLLSEGGEVARLARAGGWGAVVPVGDAAAAAAALELLLGDREGGRCRAALAAAAPRWRWSQCVAPLADALAGLPRVPRGSLAGGALGALRRLWGTGEERT